MQTILFDEILDKIIAKDPRYSRDAYLFVREGLDFAQKKIAKAGRLEMRHITGQELLESLKDYALSQYGPMSQTLLQEWGVSRCEDFGEIVFNMVDFGLLSKTDSDSKDDFKGGYDFREAFVKPFAPQGKMPKSQSSSEEANSSRVS